MKKQYIFISIALIASAVHAMQSPRVVRPTALPVRSVQPEQEPLLQLNVALLISSASGIDRSEIERFFRDIHSSEVILLNKFADAIRDGKDVFLNRFEKKQFAQLPLFVKKMLKPFVIYPGKKQSKEI